ncbi:MAG: YhbY family RNA-binding protein [Thermoplasmata archaeon]|nr:YhbY family RNA-binding protein [Thermoplasmata archaeon]
MERSELIKKGHSIKPTVIVGKAGLTENMELEIRAQLESRELIKVKMLGSMGPSSTWKKDIESLSQRIKATVVEIKGGTILLFKRSSKKKK